MPERSAVAHESVAPAAAPAAAPAPVTGGPAHTTASAAIGGSNERLVRRTITDVFGIGRSLYEKSPALVQYGVDNVVWLSRPVVTKVVTKVNPLAQGLVDRLDDGVDSVASKLSRANTTATNAGADLKVAASNSLTLVSKKWHTTVDGILVPLHPILAANVFVTQASEQFRALFTARANATAAAAAADSSSSDGSGDEKSAPTSVSASDATTSVNAFISRLRVALSGLWDDRLLPLSEAFYATARQRYEAGAKNLDDALGGLKQALGAQWHERVTQIFQTRVGTPSVDVYHRVLTKFIQLHDAQAPEIRSSAQFVAVVRASLGAVWTDRLKEPIVELYDALVARTQHNADAVRAVAAQLHALNADAVKQQYASLTGALQVQLHAVLSSAQARAEQLSHWSLRGLYQTGTGLVTSAVDTTVQRTLQLSASTLDFVLPRGEGEAQIVADTTIAAPAPAATTGAEAAAAPAADAKAAVPDATSAPPTGAPAPANRLTLRVLGDRASQRVRARLARAVTATRQAVTKSDAKAADVSSKAAAYVGVDVYTESKQFLARTQQLLQSIQAYATDTAVQVQRTQSAGQRAALARVRTALTNVNAEFAKHTATLSALVARLEARAAAVPVVARTRGVAGAAVAALRARLALAVTKLQALAASAKDLSDQLLDAEIAALPHDILRLLRVLPALLPASVQLAAHDASTKATAASVTATAKVKALVASLTEAVRALLAYTTTFTRRSAAAAPAPAAAPGGLLAVPSSASLSVTPNDSPTLVPARTETPPPNVSVGASSASASSASASTTTETTTTEVTTASPAPHTQTPVKQLAAEYEAHTAAAAQATPAPALSKRKAGRKAKANKKAAAAAAADDDEAGPGAASADE